MSSDVKNRVVARVTAKEYVPTKTVELRPDQCVIDQLKPNWHQPSCTCGYDPRNNERDLDVNCRVHMPKFASLEEGIDFVAVGFEAGGVVENAEPVIIGEQVSDHVLPKVVVERMIPDEDCLPKYFEEQSSGETLTDLKFAADKDRESDDIRDGDFLLNFSDTLHTELESVLNPDTRVLRLPGPQINVEVVATPPMGALDSSEITDDSEHLAEHNARERAALDAGEPGTTKVSDREMFIPGAHGTINAKPALQSVQLTDYEMAAELNISVHAYRHFARQVSLVEERAVVRAINAMAVALVKSTALVQQA